MKSIDNNGTEFIAGSYKIAEHLTPDHSHNIYVVRNNQLLGWIDVKDQVREEAATVINYLNKKNLWRIFLWHVLYNGKIVQAFQCSYYKLHLLAQNISESFFINENGLVKYSLKSS